MKKIIYCLLTVILIACVLFCGSCGLFNEETSTTATTEVTEAPIEEPVEEPDYSVGLIYTKYSDTEIQVAKIGDCKDADIIIPSEYKGYTVVGILKSAFAGNTEIKSVFIPDTVRYIAKGAFNGCASLETITLPFVGSAVDTDVAYEFSFGYIFGTTANSYSKAVKQYYSYSLKQYETYYIPKSLKNVFITGEVIHDFAFAGCHNLINIYVSNNVANIGAYAFYACGGLTVFPFPSNVESIGDYAFAYCTGLNEVTLPDNTKEIGKAAFLGCTNLQEFNFSVELENIADYAFKDCTSLTSVKLPHELKSIGFGTFNGCASLNSITLSFIGHEATLSDTGYQYAFGYIFGNKKYTGGTATKQYFSNSTYDTYYIPTGLKTVIFEGTELPARAFFNCTHIGAIYMTGECLEIGDYAFYNCAGLTELAIPTTVTKVGEGAFMKCASIGSMYFSDNLMSVGANAFDGCKALDRLTFANKQDYVWRAYKDDGTTYIITLTDPITNADLLNGTKNTKYNDYNNEELIREQVPTATNA